jgi:hypothetical protein
MEATNKMRDYSTAERRIAHVAWAYNRQYGVHSVNWPALGFSDEEIGEGAKLGAALCDEASTNYAIHGDPAYGSWRGQVEQPIQKHVLAMMEGREVAS